jgi:hypothetical protein
MLRGRRLRIEAEYIYTLPCDIGLQQMDHKNKKRRTINHISTVLFGGIMGEENRLNNSNIKYRKR